MDEIELEQAWLNYKGCGDEQAKKDLMQHYYPLVESIGNKLSANFPPNVDKDDLIADGVFGLAEALERFDDQYGFRFEAYAALRIRGEMLDKMRKADWVPRSLRAKIRLVEKASLDLSNFGQDSVNDSQIAAELGIDESEVRDAISMVHGYTKTSFEEPIRNQSDDSETLTIADLVTHKDYDTSSNYDIKELMNHLGEAIDMLPEREKVVTILYYVNEFTLGKIGEVMEITEARACQLHTKAMLRLKDICSGVQ